MNILSTIVTAIAVVKYMKVLKEYNTAANENDENKELVMLAIETYQTQQNKLKDKYETKIETETDGNSRLSSIQVSYILRVGNLVGKYCNAQMTLVISNTSTDRTYYLSEFKAQPTIKGYLAGTIFKNTNTIYIRPTETVEVPFGRMVLANFDMDMLRNLVCEKAGKKLITSCPKTTIEGVTTADIEFEYVGEGKAGVPTRAIYNGVDGILRYCGEAFYE